jgi:hypothetical protein
VPFPFSSLLKKEAEAFAAGLPDVAAQLHASDPELYPKTIWADWLSGDHKPQAAVIHAREYGDLRVPLGRAG